MGGALLAAAQYYSHITVTLTLHLLSYTMLVLVLHN